MEKKFNLGLTNYSKKYNKIIFDNIDVELKDQFVCLLGENGTGKTTLLKSLYSLDKTSISYFEQNFSLFENASGKENICLINKKIDEDLLKKLKIDTIVNQKITNMSAGERQRIICYMSLIVKNDWIFIDEIDNHLDLANSDNYYSILSKNNCNYLMISHHRNLIEKYCNQQLTIDQKRIISNFKTAPLLSNIEHKKQSPISLIKLFFKKCNYIWLFLINLLFCITSISFSSLELNDVNAKYQNDIFNYQVEPSLYKDDKEIRATYNTLHFFNDNEQFKKVYVDLISLFENNNGIYLNNSKMENIYLSDIYNHDLNFSKNPSDFELYLSKYDQNSNADFIFQKKIDFQNVIFDINIKYKIKIKGYLDIPKGYCFYDNDQLENYLNHNIVYEEKGIIDFAKTNPTFIPFNFSNVKFKAVLNYLPDFNDIGETITLNDLTLNIKSSRLNWYLNEYKNFLIDSIIYYAVCVSSITLMFSIASYFLINFSVKYQKTFKSFYLIYGKNKIDLSLLSLMLISLYVFPLISLILLLI